MSGVYIKPTRKAELAVKQAQRSGQYPITTEEGDRFYITHLRSAYIRFQKWGKISSREDVELVCLDNHRDWFDTNINVKKAFIRVKLTPKGKDQLRTIIKKAEKELNTIHIH